MTSWTTWRSRRSPTPRVCTTTGCIADPSWQILTCTLTLPMSLASRSLLRLGFRAPSAFRTCFSLTITTSWPTHIGNNSKRMAFMLCQCWKLSDAHHQTSTTAKTTQSTNHYLAPTCPAQETAAAATHCCTGQLFLHHLSQDRAIADNSGRPGEQRSRSWQQGRRRSATQPNVFQCLRTRCCSVLTHLVPGRLHPPGFSAA